MGWRAGEAGMGDPTTRLCAIPIYSQPQHHDAHGAADFLSQLHNIWLSCDMPSTTKQSKQEGLVRSMARRAAKWQTPQQQRICPWRWVENDSWCSSPDRLATVEHLRDGLPRWVFGFRWAHPHPVSITLSFLRPSFPRAVRSSPASRRAGR